MTDKDITASINNWNQLVLNKDEKSANAIVTLFENCGNSFAYAINQYSEKCKQLHLYPGIYQGSLYFFVIPAEYDTAAYVDSFSKYTIPCKVYYNLQSNQIPESEAKARMKRWGEEYAAWIPKQMTSAVGMFQAFTLDRGDFELEKTIIYMGLLPADSYALDRADLIVTNLDSSLVLYDDAAGVVPPFGPSAASTSFYLLNS